VVIFFKKNIEIEFTDRDKKTLEKKLDEESSLK